jgi:hypothetical protein
MLTKTDITALRKCDAICVHLDSHHPAGLVRVIKRKDYNSTNPLEDDKEHIITAPVGFATWRGCDELKAGHARCFATVSLYHNQRHTAVNIIATLREGDEISFKFYPDAHSNGYCAMSGLHADSLYLNVRRSNGKVYQWELTSSICPSNSARMCQGIADSESYRNDGREARKGAMTLQQLQYVWRNAAKWAREAQEYRKQLEAITKERTVK